ncbi:hypothetical protein [Arthrobacter sp. Marseille-P9274]|uniref:hypothetical protein n=1 Tax=Arthrobacter sp. Marseille-P9274 TaxID=2866572 RepID=UPI0021C86F1A|nr:hypothetical protein [Arthrobacter sp. Marseille-P9274]
METYDVLASRHCNDRWTADTVRSMAPRLQSDPELAEFVATAPDMARALKAVLNLDLGEDAERRVRAEINAVLRRSANPLLPPRI